MEIPSSLGGQPSLPPAIFSDFKSLDALRASARQLPDSDVTTDSALEEREHEQLTEVARQFSSIFLHMALKSMREASFGGGILDSKQSDFYRDMFDQQLALDLSASEGFGLADVIVDQLSTRVEPTSIEQTAVSSSSVGLQKAAALVYARIEESSSATETPVDADNKQ